MTTNQRVQLQPAFVLHRKPYRDTSLLVELFSESYGRVGLVARGARQGKKGLAGLLQPFQRLLVSWGGRGELVTLTGLEPGGRPMMPSGEALISGLYLNELLLRLTERHDPHPELFVPYFMALQALTDPELDGEWQLRLFERELLSSLGYGLLLEHDAEQGEPICLTSHYCYHLQQGPMPLKEPCDLAISGKTLLSLAGHGTADTQTRREAKRLMRAALRLYLGDRPLASREMFRRSR